jgi:hypothetical protein
MKITNLSLGIGLPLTWPYLPSAFFDSFIAMEKPDYTYIREMNGPIEAMRNSIVNRAMRCGCTHLLMLDADMVYHPKTITRLLSHKLPIVGALCYRRYPPFDPIVYKGELNTYKTIEDTEYEKGDLIEVDATGSGCILFEMTIFQQMPEPWFRFRPNPNQELGGTVGEDIGFCSDLRKAGHRIFVDTSVPSGHLSLFEVTDESYKIYQALMKNKTGGK